MSSQIAFEYIDRSKATRLFWLVAVSGALGGFAGGYDLGIIGNALNVINIHLTPAEIGLSGSALLLGALFSSIFAGQISDVLGRKWLLVFDGVLFTVAPLLLAFATFDYITLSVWRIVEGIALGMDDVMAGIFIGEMVPSAKRYGFVATQQLLTVIGLFAAFWIGYFLTPSANWRLMFGLGAIPAAIILVIRTALPESPRWLVAKGRLEEAKQVLVNSFKVEVVDAEFNNFVQAVQNAWKSEGSWRDIFAPGMRRYALIAILTGAFVSLSGTTVIAYYSPQIFRSLGYSKIQAAFASGWVTGVASLWPVPLAQFVLINRIGVKKAFLMGAAGMAASLLISSLFLMTLTGYALGIAAIMMIFTFRFFYEAGYGTALWSFSPDIFPTKIRGRGTSLFMMADFLLAFITTFTFPILLSMLGLARTMAIFGFINVVALLFFIFEMPSRHGKPLPEVPELAPTQKVVQAANPDRVKLETNPST